jgi:hypothetical protein
MGVLGITHLFRIRENTRFKTTVAGTYHDNATLSKSYKDDILDSFYGDDMAESKLFIAEEFRTRTGTRDNLLIGASIEAITMNYLDSVYLKDPEIFVHQYDLTGKLILLQGYVQWNHRFSNELSAVSGLHIQKKNQNREIALEPRVSLQWQAGTAHSFSVGYGLHSQLQARNVYFREVLIDTLLGVYVQPNKNLDFSKSHHVVLGYNYLINENLRLKAEAYYQQLYDIPVKRYPSSICVLNDEAGYYGMNLDSLVNKGTGRNMGIEITFERFITGNYYYLATFSLFDSKYEASDHIKRNTAYNGNYVFNALGGYEFKLPRQQALTADLKFTWAGGMRAIPIDLAASQLDDETVYDFAHAFENRNKAYYRLDLRISFEMNRRKYSQEWAIDITNITNHKNRFFTLYNPDTDEIEEASQMGIVPVMLWRIRF